MTEIAETAFASLEAEGRLLNPVFKGPTRAAGRYGFRGELALRFTPLLADERRPPELVCAQVITIADKGAPALPFFAGYLRSFAELKDLAAVLAPVVKAAGKYFVFCGNLDLGTRYQVPHGGVMWYVLPIDEATVYNELLDLFRIERNDLKKLDTAGKLDAIAKAASGYDITFDIMTYPEGLARMGPVRDPNENRPV